MIGFPAFSFPASKTSSSRPLTEIIVGWGKSLGLNIFLPFVFIPGNQVAALNLMLGKLFGL
jgi:hypothetical protein